MTANNPAAKEGVSRDFRRQLEGYGLTTAQILYRLPDHPSLLQTYLWQDYDICPRFPVLNRFLAFWLETLEGPLHSVTVAHARLIRPTAIRALIRQLVEAEDGKKPLSDARIADLLGQQGIVVARRTVAKYRESMNIPPVSQRKTI